MIGKTLRTLAAAAAVLCLALPALAQTPVKSTLDWKFEGPAAPYFIAAAKGYFKQAGLDVTIDSGNGSSGAVNRVATGAYDIGFADINSLIEFNAQNPDKALKAVFMVYDYPPFAIFSMKKAGIAKPADLAGKTLGAPIFDAPRKTFSAFAKAVNLDPASVTWQTMDPPLREPMLIRGDVNAISGFYFTSLLNLEKAGVKAEDLNIFKYPDFGVKLYGNAIIISPEMAKKPELVKGFLAAVAKGWKEAIADPKAAIAFVKEKDGLIDAALEEKRLKLCVDMCIATPFVKENGMGGVDPARLAKAIEEASVSFGLKTTPKPEQVFDASFMPDKDARKVF